LSIAQQNNLVSNCFASQIACEQAVERGTHEKQAWMWRWWQEHTKSIGIKKDHYLTNFSREQKYVLIRAFAMAVREARFSKPTHKRLAAYTVRDTAQFVCATF
jgi:hypothetical protein